MARTSVPKNSAGTTIVSRRPSDQDNPLPVLDRVDDAEVTDATRVRRLCHSVKMPP